MSTTTKTTTAALVTAGFAIFASPALADRPSDPGKAGRDNAASKQAAKKKAKKSKGIGFTVSGVDLSGLAVTDGKLTAPLSLDPTAANKHARSFLDLTKAEIAGEDTVRLGLAGDAVLVRFVGLSSTDAILPTDVVKVIGKTTRVRKGDTTTTRTLDIRKITVTRGGTENATEQAATTTSASSSSSSKRASAPGQACRTQSRKKVAGQKKTAFAECVSGFKAQQAEQRKPADERKSPAETCAGKSRKKAEGQAKSAFAACVSGAAKAQNDARPS